MTPPDHASPDTQPHARQASTTAFVHSLQQTCGETGRLIADFDWSHTPLGPVTAWPESLRTATGILLRSPVPIVMLWGEDGYMIYNDAYSVFAGGRHPQLLGSKVREGWAEIADFNDNVMKVGLAGKTLAYTNQELTLNRAGKPEQVWMNLDYSPVPDESGRPAGVIAIVVETTQQVLTERELQHERERFVQLFQETPTFMAVTRGPEHVFDYSNPAYQQLIGHRDIVGRPVRDAVPEASSQGYLDLLDEVYRTGKPFRANSLPVDLQRKPGGAMERRYIDLLYQPIFATDGTVTGIFTEGSDVTERERALQDVIAARNAAEAANIAKGEFLANMSHEIRTPMNVVVGLSNLLAMTKPLTARQTEFLDTLRSSAASLLDLINDLLDVARIEAASASLQTAPFSLDDLVRETVAMLDVRAREKALRIVTRLDCPAGRIHVGDVGRIRQIVVNLLGNAIKFTERGQVTVSVHCTADGDGHTDEVALTISDTGIGIAADKIDAVFEKFVQADSSINRRYGGSGLGLAITRNLVEAMGGTITVDSRPDEGSCFTVTLPLPRAAADMPPTGVSSARTLALHRAADLAPVLLVEDHEPNILVAESLLEGLGYPVTVARSGLEALDLFKANTYGAVLMDVQMPGLSGLETTHLIRQHEKHTGALPTPIIGVTAHATAADRNQCLDAGMDDYLSKPFDFGMMQSKLARYTKVIS